MAMTKTREFQESDRYVYDQLLFKAGWATLDTDQDAWYYGNWADPVKRVLFCYAEGDCITTECETDAEFRAEVERVVEWHRENGRFIGIDCGLASWSQGLHDRFVELGLEGLLH